MRRGTASGLVVSGLTLGFFIYVLWWYLTFPEDRRPQCRYYGQKVDQWCR